MAYEFKPIPFYDMISGLGDTVAGGIKKNKIKGAMEDFNGDWDAAAQELMRLGYTDEATSLYRSASGGQDKYGLNPVFDEKGNAYQTNSGGGMTPLEVPGGGRLTAPNRWLETPDGYVQVPARGPVGGGSVQGPQPHSVPTESYTMGPDGQPQPAPAQSGAVPSLGSQKQKHDMASNAVSDSNVINSFDDQIAHFSTNLKRIVTPDGGPSDAFKNVAGTEKVLGFDTGIPKSLTAWSEKSREQLSALKSMQVQQGLNILKGMRADSAQGASGMGQLAIQESLWLQKAIVSLEEANSPEEIIARAEDVQYFMSLVSQRLRAGYREIYGRDPSPSNAREGTPPSQRGTAAQPEGYQSPAAAPPTSPSGGSGNRTSTGIQWSIE